MAKRKTIEEKIKKKEKWLKELTKERDYGFRDRYVARDLGY